MLSNDRGEMEGAEEVPSVEEALKLALWVSEWVEQFEKLVPLAPERIEVSDGRRTSKSVLG
jgi:hypothetical protein